MATNSNVNALIKDLGCSLKGFFEFCEKTDGMQANHMMDLYYKYYSDDTPKPVTPKPVTPKPLAPKPVSPKPVSPIHAFIDNPPRKNDKNNIAKPRAEQTVIDCSNLGKKKLSELKDYARERGVPVSGTKAQVIETLEKYESNYNTGGSAAIESDDKGNDFDIELKRPTTTMSSDEETDDKLKYTVVERHGIKMIDGGDLNISWNFVLNNKDVVIGWVEKDEDSNTLNDDKVNIHQLDKKKCEFAKKCHLTYELPENLD
jgi:hypothetical protein